MARTPSNMIPLGTKLIDSKLPDTVSGQELSLNELSQDKTATVIMFICNHCPFVILLHERLTQVIKEYSQKNIQFIAISANDAENFPQDAPDKMTELAKELGWEFPYLYDESQETAKAYKAACTPDFYIFDSNQELVYRGQFCPARPESGIPVTGEDLTNALDAVINDEPVMRNQRPSLGCNIKWKS